MKLRYLVGSLFIIVSTMSCGEFSKLIEGNDYEKQYQEALRYFREGKTNKSLSLLVNIDNIYSGSDRSDTIKFYIASSCFERADYNNSAELYDSFRKNFTRSAFLEKAQFLYAMSYYNLAPSSELDQNYAGLAKSAFEEFINHYPNSNEVKMCEEYIIELQERIHKKEFYVGETYYNISYYSSAIKTLKNILKKDAETPLREDILFLILKSQYEYAKQSIEEKQKERFYAVVDSYYSLTSQFPEGKYSRFAKKLYENAEDFTKGATTIENLYSDNIKIHDKEYKKKEKIERKMLDEDKKGEKKSMSKLLKLKEQLDEINEEIRILEEGKDSQIDADSTKNV